MAKFVTLTLECGHKKTLSVKDAEITTTGHKIFCIACRKLSKVV